MMEVAYIRYNTGTRALPDIYALALGRYASSGIVHIYQATHSCLCYNLYILQFAIYQYPKSAVLYCIAAENMQYFNILLHLYWNSLELFINILQFKVSKSYRNKIETLKYIINRILL